MIRLLKYDDQKNLCFEEFPEGDNVKIPDYAILSHTWSKGEEEEMLFDDMKKLKLGRVAESKPGGYAKIMFTMDQAESDKLDYCWVDTCCINKADEDELPKALESMFDWYQRSAKCYVYLSDVDDSVLPDPESQMRASKWFTRGWTLQELLAPTKVEFFSVKKTNLGDKIKFSELIKEITKIPIEAILGTKSLREFGVAQKFYWRAGRETEKPQDQAYCLLGILDVKIDLTPGQEDTAFARLLDAVFAKDYYDPSLWPSTSPVKLPGEIPHRKVSQDDPLFKKTQAEMEKNIQLATFLTAHYHFSAAEELFLLTLHDAEGALGEPQSRPSLDLDTEVNLDPDINVDAASYVNFLLRRLGNVFHNQRKLPEAVKRYRRALDEHNVGEIDPSFLYETQNNLGIVYMEMHNMDEAEKMHNMDEAEKFASFAAESRGMLVKEAEEKLAAEEKKKNSVKEAEEKLERAKVVWVRSINNLAAIHQYQGRLDDARHGYNKALDVVTTSPRPWRFGLEELQTRINLGRLYMKEGEGRSGEDGYEGARKAIEAFYEAIGAWERKAQAEWEEKANAEGDKVMGDVELTQQQLTHPSGLLAFECMAKAYSRLEKWDEAQEKFGQAFAGHLSARHIQICDTAKSWATFLVNRNRPGPARWALSTAKDVLMANYSTYEQGLKELDDLRREIDRIIEPEILCWCDGKIEAAIEHEILHQLSGETNARVKKDPLNMSGNNTQQQIRHGFWDGIGDGIKQQVERKIEDKLDDGIKQHTRTQSPDKFTDETKQKMKQNILDKIAEDLEGQVEWKVSPDKLADGSN